jgi:hypothetical protein
VQKMLAHRLNAFVLLLLVFGCSIAIKAQGGPVVLTGPELTRVIPTSFYFQGQSAPTQMRNSTAARFAPERFVLAGLVDTSGYSSEVRGKYEGFFITDSPINVEGQTLATGAYGFGFSSDGKMNLFDVGGKLLFSVPAHNDKALQRARPLIMVQASDQVRLYNGRNYVIIGTK